MPGESGRDLLERIRAKSDVPIIVMSGSVELLGGRRALLESFCEKLEECGAEITEDAAKGSLTDTVADWRAIAARETKPRCLPLPHPSWRNNAWLKRNPWFETDLLPDLRREVRELIGPAPASKT